MIVERVKQDGLLDLNGFDKKDKKQRNKIWATN